MIRPPQHFLDFFTSSLVYYLAIASLCTTLMLAVTGSFDLRVPAREAPTSFSNSSAEGEKFNFSMCTYYSGPGTFDILEGIAGVVYGFLILPSLITTSIFVTAIHSVFPSILSSLNTVVLAIAFFFYNCYYWISLAYATSSIHYNFVRERKPEFPLSITEGR